MDLYPTYDEAQDILKEDDYRTFPVSFRTALHKTSDDIYRILKNKSHNVFVLESAEDSKNWGRYTFLGYDPTLEITSTDSTPHARIRKIIADHKSPRIENLPPFTGGLVGYFAYEFIKYSEPVLKLDALDEEAFKDVDLMLFDKLIVLDNLKNEIIYIVNISTENFAENYKGAETILKKMQELVTCGEPVCEEEGKLLGPLTPLFDKAQYCDMVNKAKKYIYEGDIFQVVLSNRLSAGYSGSLFNTFCELKKTNPSPYMFYFSSDNIEIAGASPETLVKLDNSKVTTFPLAGTRPRGRTPKEDMQLEKELLADEKECAEHNMLVDLGRNDIGKISEFGTVNVEKYMEIERFSHVMHIGSTVSGKLRADKDALDAVDSILPAGTLSGAPKIRACEIINELENNKRGIYGGAIGYLDFNGNVDTCIAIRLAFKKNGKVFVRSGAGIVADSVPEREYEECINKAKAVVNALEVNTDGSSD